MYSISLYDIHRTSKLQVYLGVLRLNLPALGDPEFVPNIARVGEGRVEKGIASRRTRLKIERSKVTAGFAPLGECNFVLCPVV